MTLLSKKLVLSLLIFAFTLPAAADALEFEECEIADTSGKRTMKALCATYSVPENYAEPDGKHIELFVAKIASMSKNPEPDPFTLLAGGPGQSATEAYMISRGALEKVRKQRDIILVDQRGTGKSNQMQCQQEEDDYADSYNYDSEKVKVMTRTCLEELPGDPRFYSTSIAVKDLDAVRQAIGFEQWNVWGGSYGTRVAQHYLRRYPQHTRTVVLDAVAPPPLNLGPDIALESQRAVNQMTARCAEDTVCQKTFPELGKNINELVARLKDQPENISFENFSTGEIETMEFGAGHLALTIRMSLYSAHGVSILPTMLHNAYAQNNFAPLARRAKLVADDLGNALSLGMHNSVVCTEDVPFYDTDNIDVAALDQTYMGTAAYNSLKDMCSLWPVGEMDPDFKELVETDIPVLVLSGSIDPITPPAYAEMILPGLKNSLHLVIDNQGHIQSSIGCMPTVVAKFVAEASVADLSADCLQRQTPEPFFINANGPAP